MNTFNQAECYEKNCSHQKRNGLHLLKLLAPEKGYKVLDIGCGPGSLTKVIADMVGPEGKVVGIDPDVERLKIAREKYSASNLEYLEGSALCIPGEETEYDIVFSNYVFHYVKDIDKVLKEVRAKLKQGGKFGFVHLNFDCVKSLATPPLMFSREFLQAYTSAVHYTSWDEFNQLASNNHFEISDVNFIKQDVYFGGASEFAEFHRAHMRGRFDETHCNLDAVRQHYGDGEFCQVIDLVEAVYFTDNKGVFKKT